MTTNEADPTAKGIPHELIASQERERVPDFEQDEDIIRVSFDNAICTKLRALHFCKIPRHAKLDPRNTALGWLNISGVFSVEKDGEQIPCTFEVNGGSGEEVRCVLESGETFFLNNGVSESMRLCIFQPGIFDGLVTEALHVQTEFSRRAESQVKKSNKTRGGNSDFSLDLEQIDRYVAGIDLTTMREMEHAQSLDRKFRQVITPTAEQPGSCTSFFEWVAGLRKSNKFTYAVRFNDNQIQFSLVGMKLDGRLHNELIEMFTKVFGTTSTALFPSLLEAGEIVSSFLPNLIEERVENRGRVQREKLTFDHLKLFQQQIHNNRVPRIRLGKTVVDISDDTRVMTPTIYISF